MVRMTYRKYNKFNMHAIDKIHVSIYFKYFNTTIAFYGQQIEFKIYTDDTALHSVTYNITHAGSKVYSMYVTIDDGY